MGPVLNRTKTSQCGKSKSPVRELTGLCMGCAISGSCTYPKDSNRPIIHCEEFEAFPCRLPKVDDDKLRSMVLSVSRRQSLNEQPSDSQGLCQYCIKSDTCTYPKKPGGIWNCDEYKESC